MIDVNNTLNDTSNKEHVKIEHNKKFRYVNERKELTKKLLQLLKVDNNNKIFNTIDINEDTQKAIIDMVPEIKKYFNIGQWYYFQNNKNIKDRPYLSITKSLLKDMNIFVTSEKKKRKIENKYMTLTIYTINNDLSQFI